MLVAAMIAVGIGAAVLIVIANDWWKRRLPLPVAEPHRLRDLNRPMGFFQKLGTTILLLLFAALVTPLFFFGLHLLPDPVVRAVAKHIVETIAVFYVLLLVFIWWRPKWIVHLYDHAETKLVLTGYIVGGIVLIIAIVALAACALR
jgi:hypothetical protein